MEPQDARIIQERSRANGVTSARQLAVVLREDPDCQFSHVTTNNWWTGAYLPTDDNLALIMKTYQDWRGDMARAILEARRDYYAGLVEGAPSENLAP